MARPASLSRQVAAQIRDAYVSPATAVTTLPSERALASEFKVARATVRAALHSLEEEGVLHSTPGRSHVVLGPHVSKSPGILSFTDEIAGRGWQPTTVVISLLERTGDRRVEQGLNLEAGTPYAEVTRIRLADDIPLCLETVAIPAAICPGLADADLTGSLYAHLQATYGIAIVRHDRTITAVNLDTRTATLLRVPRGSAALYAVQVGYDEEGRSVELGHSFYRGDRYDFTTTTAPRLAELADA